MFKDLYDAWRKENETGEIQPLDAGFYSRLSSYLKELEEEAKSLDGKSLKARLKIKEMSKAAILASDLVHLRFKKMVKSALLSEEKTLETPILGEEEKVVYGEIRNAAKAFFKLRSTLKKGKIASDQEEREKGRKTFLRFLKESPALIGADLKAYGPFEVEDVACLPPEIAEGLIRYGVAKRVKPS